MAKPKPAAPPETPVVTHAPVTPETLAAPAPIETPPLPDIAPVIATLDGAADAAEHARVTQVRKVAKEGWDAFAEADRAAARRLLDASEVEDKEFVLVFAELDTLQKNGLYAMVQGIIEDPHGATWASIMPANHDRRAVRALDNSFRSVLGYSAYRHEGE